MTVPSEERRKELINNLIQNTLEDVLGSLGRELAEVTERSRLFGGLASSAHLDACVEFFLGKMKALADGVLQAYLQGTSSSRDFSEEELYPTIKAALEALHRQACDFVVQHGQGLDAGSSIATLESGKLKILNRAQRDMRNAVLSMELEESQRDSKHTPSEPGSEVFVVMSLASELDILYDKAIKPAVEACGLTAYRVDRDEPESTISEEILALQRHRRSHVRHPSSHNSARLLVLGTQMQ